MTLSVTPFPAESDAALEELFAIAEDSLIVYEHQWRLGDLVIWDNWCSIHARKDFPAPVSQEAQHSAFGC